MRIFYNRSFFRALSKLESVEQGEIKESVGAFLAALEASQAIPLGFGLKRLRASYFEIRAGLALRALFHRNEDIVEWMFVGNHDEVHRFLKRL